MVLQFTLRVKCWKLMENNIGFNYGINNENYRLIVMMVILWMGV